MSSKRDCASQPMHSKSDNIETVIDNYTKEIINKLLVHFLLDLK